MAAVVRIPNLEALVQPYLGTSYADANCWQLCRLLIQEGFGIDVASDPTDAAQAVVEVWARGDPEDPLTLVQPWDLVIMLHSEAFPVSNHVALVVNDVLLVHARSATTGVAMDRLRKWRPWFLQVARLRSVF